MMEEHRLPKFDYFLDESDPDIVVLRRQDGSYVAHFSASGATGEGIVEVAKKDFKQLIEAYAANQQGQKPSPTVTLSVSGLRSVSWSTVSGSNIGHFGAPLGSKWSL